MRDESNLIIWRPQLVQRSETIESRAHSNLTPGGGLPPQETRPLGREIQINERPRKDRGTKTQEGNYMPQFTRRSSNLAGASANTEELPDPPRTKTTREQDLRLQP